MTPEEAAEIVYAKSTAELRETSLLLAENGPHDTGVAILERVVMLDDRLGRAAQELAFVAGALIGSGLPEEGRQIAEAALAVGAVRRSLAEKLAATGGMTPDWDEYAKLDSSASNRARLDAAQKAYEDSDWRPCDWLWVEGSMADGPSEVH